MSKDCGDLFKFFLSFLLVGELSGMFFIHIFDSVFYMEPPVYFVLEQRRI